MDRKKVTCKTAVSITPHVHYRMASVEVGYPLKEFLGTKELVHGGYTSFLGRFSFSSSRETTDQCSGWWAALLLCLRLHRDISLDNIILVKKHGKWRIGFLIDWEFSSKADGSGHVHDNVRTVGASSRPITSAHIFTLGNLDVHVHQTS